MSQRRPPQKPPSKKTVALLQQLQRRRGIRDLPKRFLIVCEDHKSAPNYFEALKKYFGLSATSVQVVGSGGHTQPLQVVRRAINVRDEAAKADSGTEPFDQVWCVIDGDYGTLIRNARFKADANKIELAISTKCFEYWVLLHFEENDTSTFDCDGVVARLRGRHLPKYEKGTCDFRPVVARVQDACERAERLRRPGVRRGDAPESQNPCSEVYKLVNAILEARG